MALVMHAEVEPGAAATSAMTCHPADAVSPGWAIAERRRCTRPSGWVIVPSFSA